MRTDATLAITIYAGCLTGTLALAGSFVSGKGVPQAALALFVAALCAAVAAVLASVILWRGNVAQAKARASYVEQYGENPWASGPERSR